MAFHFRNITSALKKLTKATLLKDYEKLSKITTLQGRIPVYSTVVPKQFVNVFDILIDLLSFSRSFDEVPRENSQIIRSIQCTEIETHKIDKLIANIDLSNLQLSAKIMTNELYTNIRLKDWTCVTKILQFLVDKNVCLGQSVLLSSAKEFYAAGLVTGLKLLLVLADGTGTEHSTKGNLLHYLIKCHWETGNVHDCLDVLLECYDKHRDLISATKRLSRIIIFQSVSNRSEAVLLSVTDFVQGFTEKYNDYYLITILWHDLFTSEWYTDQQLADTLLDKYEYLSVCITMLCPSLTRHFLKHNKTNDVYRLLEVLLKRKMTQSYSTATQILFDYYRGRGDISRCSEIVKSSVILGADLRDEQYNQFISWSVSGNPYKFLKNAPTGKVDS